jgi:hypothetical protein
MIVQKLLPIARKMGEENFLAYKNYVKLAKAGKQARAELKLRGLTFIDTINFTLKDGAKADIKGFRNLLREIHKMYFPRVYAEDAIKWVRLAYDKIKEDANITTVKVETIGDDGYIGTSSYRSLKYGNFLSTKLSSSCEDFKINLNTDMILPDGETKVKKNLKIGADPRRDLMMNENGDKISFSLKSTPNEDVPKFELEAEISKEKLENIFNGGLEQVLPELIEKSGFKLDF